MIPFKAADGMGLFLTRVRTPAPTKGPVLLAGGVSVPPNMFEAPISETVVQRLAREGYDVFIETWRGSTSAQRNQFTLEQVDFLNRNQYYPEWRAAVSQVFAQLDPLLDAETARRGHARLVIVIAPAQLPVGPDRMWTRFENRGVRVAVQPPERVEEFVPLLLTGAEQGRGAPTIAQLFAASKKAAAYDSWIVEAGGSVGRLGSDGGGLRNDSL